ncbi:MAG: alanine racemase [Pseudomonadales bacterium]
MANEPVAYIHLDAIRHNFSYAQSLAPKSKVMAIVKADAYGHGAARVCRALTEADAFGVARVIEAVALRESGIDKPIVVLEGFIDEEELNICRINRLTPVLHSGYQVALVKQPRHIDLGIWIKVDTGMHRLGFSVEEFRTGMMTGHSLNVVGVMSHLANADVPGHKENLAQIEVFNEVTRDLDCELSLANSGAIVHYATSHSDWIRPGIMLYGGSPTSVADSNLKPGMTLMAPVVSVNRVCAGESIGYGSNWFAPTDTRVAVVGIGYADGYPREIREGVPVVINGELRPIVGRISMDMTYVQLRDGDDVAPGDLATLWGHGLPVDEVASWIPTISYALMSGLTGRVNRSYEMGDD